MPNGTSGLELVANRAAEWSATADALKSRLEGARKRVFGLSIGGALLAAVASQIPEAGAGVHPKTHAVVAMSAALLLAIGTFMTQRFLGASATQRWTRARAASEALKREAFRFAAGAEPYEDLATADARLQAERDRIEKDLDDLVGSQVPATRPGSSPRERIAPPDYRKKRLVAQAQGFYRPKAGTYRQTANRLKTIEFCLAAAATVVTVIAGATGRAVFGDWPFDLAALTAVLTTVSGAILAHIEASRLEHLIATYLATARRLEAQDLHFEAAATAGGSEWSRFVNQCEDIIAAENNSWVAKWTTDISGAR